MSEDTPKAKEAKRGNGTKHGSSGPTDYSIYVRRDDLKQSAPWRIASYGEDGALSQEDLSDLATRFDLAAAILIDLSRKLGDCLDQDSDVLNTKINRATAIERANRPLNGLAKSAKRFMQDLRKYGDELALLDGRQFAENNEDKGLLDPARQQVADVSEATSVLYDSLVRLIGTPGSAADMSPQDARKVVDRRRIEVVERCCLAWRDDGRELTYTTAPDRPGQEQRRGRLIDFIQAVVLKVTEPSARLRSETIRHDIDRLRKNLALPPMMKTPPTYGK